jgi:hypothetical protein
VNKKSVFSGDIKPYFDIMKQELKKAGRNYDESKNLWDNMFKCDAQGCLFKTVYLDVYNQHIKYGGHLYNRKDGIAMPKPEVKVIYQDEDESEDEDDING